MKTKNWIKLGAGTILFAAFVSSCMSEEPFGVSEDGTALVKFNLSISKAVTRAEGDQDLLSTCKIYLSNNEGLLYKWVGAQNIPSNLYLRYGNYLAEAYAGDSVPASFEAKYFKGVTPFEIGSNQVTTQVTINCKIANTVVSVDASGIDLESIENFNIELKTSSGSLNYDRNSISSGKKGYFMMPYNKTTKEIENVIYYTISGNQTGQAPFNVNGKIENVRPSYEYQLVLEKNDGEFTDGGAFIQLKIREYELEINEDAIIYGRPEFAWRNIDLDLDGQIFNSNGEFDNDYVLQIAAYDGFSKLTMTTENAEIIGQWENNREVNLLNMSSLAQDNLKEKGIELEQEYRSDNIKKYNIIFTKRWLDALPSSEEAYILTVTAEDKRGMSNKMNVSIANSNKAVQAPFIIDAGQFNKDLLAVRAYSANINVNLLEDNVENLAIQFKKTNDPAWSTSKLNELPRGQKTVKLTGLTKNSDYQCRIVGGEYNGQDYQFKSETITFHTEDVYEIPNAGMEDWHQNGKVWEPSLASTLHTFWDCGNHGSTAISANDNLTTRFTEYSHGGTSCARLESKFVGVNIGSLGVGKHGAGNIFAGTYAGTSGTNGKIDFGRSYNNSHPTKLKVWVNYRPAVAQKNKGANNSYIKEGELDQGQIYIALSDKIVSVDTGDSSTLVTEEKAPSLFLAYNQVTLTGNVGEDGKFSEIEIPFNYYDKAKTIRPEYLIIVCCASKFGDYFSGGEGSLMYVDDFELVYE